MAQEYTIAPSPARRGYRTNDALASQRRLYAILLNVSLTDEDFVVEDGETAVGHAQLRLLGTTNFSVLGTGKLAVL